MANVEPEFVCHFAELSSTSAEVVSEWIARSGKFRAMFDEYTRCQERATKLCSSFSHDQERVQEFEELSEQLEAEMRQFLQEHSGTDTVP